MKTTQAKPSRRCHQCHTYGCSNYDQCQDAQAPHTPTPWKAVLGNVWSEEAGHYVMIPSPQMNRDGDKSKLVNAAFIVRAVNNFERLRDSHEVLVGLIREILSYESENIKDRSWVSRAKANIAQAEGR